MQIEIAKITSKGQITLPVAVRGKLALKTGDKVVFIEDEQGFRIVNSSNLTVRECAEPSRKADEARKNGAPP